VFNSSKILEGIADYIPSLNGKVAKELQKGLRTLLKKANAIMKGSTFNTDFAEQVIEDHFDTIKGS